MTSDPGNEKQQLVVFRSFYGLLSETFVRDHVAGLHDFAPLVLANRLDRRGIAPGVPMVLVLNDRRLGKQLWDRALTPAVHRLFRRKRPVLIHAHFLVDAASILPFARKHGIPLVVTAHGYDAMLRDDALAKFDEGRLLLKRRTELANYASRIVCVSQYLRDELVERGWPADKLVTQPLGVDTDALRATVPADARHGIVTVGRLVEKKGTRYLIEAYAALPAELRAAHPLMVIGDGPLRQELANLASGLGLEINFAGALCHDDALREISTAALFCFPSVRAADGDAEGMGVAIMEALAVETPVVLFDDQPAAPILAEGDGGVVVPSRDSAALSRAIAERLTDPEGSAAMALRGRAQCERTFDFARNYRALERIYADVVAEAAR